MSRKSGSLVDVRVCSRCLNLATCTCKVEMLHRKDCRFLRAAKLSIELACPHGFQACPECDPCRCPGTPTPQGVF